MLKRTSLFSQILAEFPRGDFEKLLPEHDSEGHLKAPDSELLPLHDHDFTFWMYWTAVKLSQMPHLDHVLYFHKYAKFNLSPAQYQNKTSRSLWNCYSVSCRKNDAARRSPGHTSGVPFSLLVQVWLLLSRYVFPLPDHVHGSLVFPDRVVNVFGV